MGMTCRAAFLLSCPLSEILLVRRPDSGKWPSTSNGPHPKRGLDHVMAALFGPAVSRMGTNNMQENPKDGPSPMQ
jgi:hypothetical protein